MDRILELQKQLASIQKTDNSNKISDRVVVDIMNKLIQTFDMKLIYSRDGGEYITEDALCKAIQDLVIEKGRLNSLSLPDMLNINAEKIEQQMDRVCNHQFLKIYNIAGELLTSEYLDKLILEFQDELDVCLKCTFSDLAMKYHFPKPFIQKAIEDRLGTLLVRGIVKGEEIVTEGFVETLRAKVRGMLRGAIQPVYLKEIEKDVGSDGGVQEIVQELINLGDIDGKIKDNSVFIPARFGRNQEAITNGFFQANNYLELSMLEKQLSIQRPKEFIKQMFKDQAVFVEGGFVFNREALEALKHQIPQLIEIEGWTDLSAMFPSAFNEQQVEILVKSFVLGENSQKYVFHQGYIFGDAYLDKCAEKFKERIVNYIYNAPQKLITDEREDKKGKKKGTGKKKSATGQSNIKGIFNSEEIIQCLLESKVIDQDDRDFEFEEKLCSVLNQKIFQLYQKIKEELFENKKSTTTEIIQQISKKIEEKMSNFQFIMRSLKFVEQKHSKVDTTVFHKNSLNDARLVFDNLLMLICKKYLIQLPSNLFIEEGTPVNYNAEADLKAIFKDNNTRDLVIEKIPKEFQKMFKELQEYVYKDVVIYRFVEQVQSNSEIFGIKQMQDKKLEKNFFYYQKHMAKESCKGLKETMDPVKLGFFVFVSLLTEQQMPLFFCDKFDKKALMQIMLIVQEVMANDSSVIDIVNELIEVMTKKQENNQTMETAYIKVINDLLKLVKI